MQIEHHRGERRFVARLEPGAAELTYDEPGDGILDLIHTFVPPEARGRGVGEALVEHAFDHAEEQGLRIRPSCPFVREWLQEHPERRRQVVPLERG